MKCLNYTHCCAVLFNWLDCTSIFFSVECKSGYFGMGCKDVCSSHFFNNEPCDHVSGMCPYGCRDGYEGTYCQNCKNYGQQCRAGHWVYNISVIESNRYIQHWFLAYLTQRLFTFHIFLFFSRTTGLISTRPDTKHHW